MRIVTATFISDDDQGYKQGHSYKLVVNGTTVMRHGGTDGFRSYRNINSFLIDWTNVVVLPHAT